MGALCRHKAGATGLADLCSCLRVFEPAMAGCMIPCMDGHSRTTRQLLRQTASTGYREVSAEAWADALRRDPGFIHRLSWSSSRRTPTDWNELVRVLSAERDLAVFCDTSAFDDSAPNELWEVLLGELGRLVLTERVRAELLPWLEKRPDHPVARALREHHSGLSERPEPRPGQLGRRAFDYYVFLLMMRRRAIDIARQHFRREHGRDPEPGEERRLAEEVQRRLGERGRLLATKPVGNLADETLVYLAVDHALSTGRQTLILTRDADVEEQFFKLLWLIDTHYRAMLLADRYVERFGTFRTFALPDSVLNDPDGPFEPRDAVMFERDLDLVDVLPSEFHFVGIGCLNAGVYTSHLRFGAETEMANLLRVKDVTGGLSTDRLGGRNVHAWLYPLDACRRGTYAAVVYDKRQPVGVDGAAVAVLDVEQALATGEQHASLVPGAAPSRLWRPSANRRLT